MARDEGGATLHNEIQEVSSGAESEVGRDEKETEDSAVGTYLSMADSVAVHYHHLLTQEADDPRREGRRLCREAAAGGEWSVDLLNGLDPSKVADTLFSFSPGWFVGMAVEVVRSAAVVARAVGPLAYGLEWKAERGERPYSLAFIYALAMDNGTMALEAVEALRVALDDDFDPIRQYATAELFDAMAFLSERWAPMDPQTRAGIKVDIANILGPCVCDTELRRRFSSGDGPAIQEDQQLWCKLALKDLSDMSLMFGFGGGIVGTFLKDQLMADAMRMESAQIEAAMARPAVAASSRRPSL